MDEEMWFLEKIGITTDLTFPCFFRVACFFCVVVMLTEHLRLSKGEVEGKLTAQLAKGSDE
jgi:inosine/xanthosine triphosphate pyrophosphatase family protein